MSVLLNIVRNSRNLLYNKTNLVQNIYRNSYHILQNKVKEKLFLQPTNLVQLEPFAGFKTRALLKKRCKDCYFVRRHNRLFVICETHRRHKQMQIVKDERNTWTLSHATQGKVRPW